MRRYIVALLLFCFPVVAYAITTNFTITVTTGPLTPIFDCLSGFAATGSCSTGFIGSGSGFTFKVVGTNSGATPGFSGSAVNLMPANTNHAALNLNYQPAAVNIGQFSTTFTYVPNGENLNFILTNNTNSASATTGPNFSAGASCEGSFFQGFPGVPNNTFGFQLDQHGSLTGGGSTFTYSSVQYYDTGNHPPNAPNPPGQSPCNPDLGGSGFTYVGVNKVSTSPVPLNSPAGTISTTTGHTYSVTITYDGSNLTISLFDVTAGGSCPGAKCFTNTWAGVNIPAIVGGSTAWVGLGADTGSAAPQIPAVSLLVNTWSYSSN